MAASVTHLFTSAKSDGADSTLVKPSDWNAAHVVTGVDLTGKKCIPIPSAAMTPVTGATPSAGTSQIAGNGLMLVTLDFDSSGIEAAQFSIAMPDSWDEGTVTFRPIWSHAATTTNFGVVWSLAGAAFSDNDAGGTPSLQTGAQTSVDTGGTTDNIYIGPESSAITINGTPAQGDFIVFQIRRTPADASDTMAIDARLHAIKLFITTAAGNDA